MKATFHERQYELALNLELIGGSGMFFAPMQVIEESVGYDIALVPGETAVWAHLGVGSPPPGVDTVVAYDPKLNPVPAGQTFTASLFVQHKRPERMLRTSAVEAPGRRSRGAGVPFFRVRLDKEQHGVLMELENRVGGDAVVRYAAALFYRIEDLWVRQATRAVIEGSTFIPPSAAGDPPSCWTYDDSGAPIYCSEPRIGELEGRSGLLRSIVRVARARERLQRTDHLRALAAEVEGIDLASKQRRQRLDDRYLGGSHREGRGEAEWVRPPLERSEWARELRAAAPQRTDDEVAAAVDAAVIANAVSSIGLTWFIADIRESSGLLPGS